MRKKGLVRCRKENYVTLDEGKKNITYGVTKVLEGAGEVEGVVMSRDRVIFDGFSSSLRMNGQTNKRMKKGRGVATKQRMKFIESTCFVLII